MGFPVSSDGKESACHVRPGFNPWVGKIPWRREQPTPVFLPGESHGQRRLVNYSPRDGKELDSTEQLSTAQEVVPLPDPGTWLPKQGANCPVCAHQPDPPRDAAERPPLTRAGSWVQLPGPPANCRAKHLSSPAVGWPHHTFSGCPCQTLLKHIITARAEGYLHSAIDVRMTDSAAASITLQKCSIIQSQGAGTLTIKSASTIEGP